MDKEYTVFIVGAGGSLPYGFPLGLNLQDQIIANLKDSQSNFHKDLKRLGFQYKEITEFANSLELSKLYSIDKFINAKPDRLLILGKLAVAQEILRRKYDFENIDISDDWYKEVWNKIIHKPNKNHLKNNSLVFITYNYDLSLEYYFFNVIKSAYELSNINEINKLCAGIPIIHLHGYIGSQPYENIEANINRVYESIRNFDNISPKFIHENYDNNPELLEAYKYIAQAKNIYFIGCHYHMENLDKLKINEIHKSSNTIPLIKGSAHGLTKNEIKKVEDYYNASDILCRNNCKNLEFVKNNVVF